MSSTETNRQPNGQSQSQGHSVLSQLVSLLSPDGQLLSCPEFSFQDIAAQLWQFGKVKTLFVLYPKTIEQTFILDLLNLFSKLQSQNINLDLNQKSELGLEVNLFGLKFEASFTSKLNFLKFPCHLYCVSISRNEQRDVILVKDFRQTDNHNAGASESRATDTGQLPLNANPLSAQELSEFVQFGMELRKLREAV